MYIKQLNNKLIFVGDLESINLEIVAKSYFYLVQNKIKIILIGDIDSIKKYFRKIKFKKKIIELFSLDEHLKFSDKSIFVFNTNSDLVKKPSLILNQITICSNLSKHQSFDLVTLPIDKSIIKKQFKFNGVTEFLSQINRKKTYMLMKGEKFSIIPLTTHIKFKNILDSFNYKNFFEDLRNIISIITEKKLNYKEVLVLGINPHAGEDGTLGNEEGIIKKIINIINKEFRLIKIKGPLPADSAFKETNSKQLFISYYHDQALIPFKILNKQSVNHTIGLEFNRYSPTHGTAKDILFKNKSNNFSFIQCMLS